MAYKTEMFNKVFLGYSDTNLDNELVQKHWEKTGNIDFDRNLSEEELEDIKTYFSEVESMWRIGYGENIDFEYIFKINEILIEANKSRKEKQELKPNQILSRELTKKELEELKVLRTPDNSLFKIQLDENSKVNSLEVYQQFEEVKKNLKTYLEQLNFTPLEKMVLIYDYIKTNYVLGDDYQEFKGSKPLDSQCLYSCFQSKKGDDKGLNKLMNNLLEGLDIPTRVNIVDNNAHIEVYIDDQFYGLNQTIKTDITTDIGMKQYVGKDSYIACGIPEVTYLTAYEKGRCKTEEFITDLTEEDKKRFYLSNISGIILNPKKDYISESKELIDNLNNALDEKEDEENIHINFAISGLRCTYNLEKEIDNKIQNVETKTFSYDDNFKTNIIEPAFKIYSEKDKIKDNIVFSNNDKSSLFAKNEKNDSISIYGIDRASAEKLSELVVIYEKTKPKVLEKKLTATGYINIFAIAALTGFMLGMLLATAILLT